VPGRERALQISFSKTSVLTANRQQKKALKGLLILNGIVPPQTHSLAHLIEALEKHDVCVPDDVKTAVSLTHYAVSTRYPGSYEPVKEREYQKALKGAGTVFFWVEQQFNDAK